MKRTFLLASLVLLAGFLATAQKTPDSMLGAALHQEEVQGDLKGAIAAYQNVLAAPGVSRRTVAEALLHLGQCYEKLGNADSRKAYERVVREYADQKDAAATARARLAAQGASTPGGNTRQVWTKSGGFPYGPVSPDGRYVAFTSRGTYLAVHDLITGADLTLTNTLNPGERLGRPVFSPDARQIGYTWIGKEESELRVIELNGKSPSRVLFKSDDIQGFGCEDWSPDGKWIALQLSRKDRTRQLGVISTVDGKLRVLKSVDWAGSTKVYFSPDSRYLAFDLLPNENSKGRDIFVIAVDGSLEAPAVTHPANDRVAGWTPDGKHLLFMSDRNGRSALWSLPFESGKPQANPKMLRADFADGDDSYLGPARNGKLYFSALGGGVRVSIASVDLDSGKSSPATMEQFTNGIYPAWSPDGKYLAYASYENNDANTFLTIYSVETGQRRELRSGLKYPTWPSWSPDSRSLMVPAADAKGRWGIFRIDAQTAEVQPIATIGPEEDGMITPQWLPDGNGIVYERGRKSGGDSVIVSRELSSGKESEIVRGKRLPNQQVSTRGFAVSPDGQLLAYLTSNGTTAHTSIMLIPLTGGQPRELLKLSEKVYLGGWTPDGQSLLYSTNASGGRAEAWLLPVHGSGQRKLDLGERFTTELQMHPDGKRIAFWSNNQTAEQIWVLENFLPVLTAK